MKRRYTRELFADKIHKIKSLMPHAFIGVDVMVGVRGETPDYFEKTRSFLDSLPVSQLHVFTYSERAGTKALDIDYNVPHAERKKRNDVLHQLSERKTQAFYDSQKGRTAWVLWESTKAGDTMHGFTENYVRVEAPYQKELINTIQKIVI
jgi:threonylcarbamoyladenosine tRNA methylthiotransferase MtaB